MPARCRPETDADWNLRTLGQVQAFAPREPPANRCHGYELVSFVSPTGSDLPQGEIRALKRLHFPDENEPDKEKGANSITCGSPPCCHISTGDDRAPRFRRPAVPAPAGAPPDREDRFLVSFLFASCFGQRNKVELGFLLRRLAASLASSLTQQSRARSLRTGGAESRVGPNCERRNPGSPRPNR